MRNVMKVWIQCDITYVRLSSESSDRKVDVVTEVRQKPQPQPQLQETKKKHILL